MTNKSERDLTLVLGATGKTGSRVLRRLDALGVRTRAGSRSAHPSFDWHNEATWAPTLEGVTSVYLSYYPDLAVPGTADVIRAFAQLAANSGVNHLVLLSGRGEPEAQSCEGIVQSCGVPWTIVRSSWFAQNFSEGFLRDLVLAGEVALPVGDVGEPFIDADDIADVVVAALTDERHIGELYEVTGPRLISFADAVREIARASKRAVAFVQILIDAFDAGMREQGVPDDAVWLVHYLFTSVLDGRNAHCTNGVQRALGRPPRDFVDYVTKAVAAHAWED